VGKRVAFVSSGLEHLGISALAAYVRQHRHEPVVVYEPRPFSSGSGTDLPALARWLDPSPAETAARVLASDPDLVAFTSYSVTHRWSVEVAREIKAHRAIPIVFGGAHVSAAPERAIREASVDAVVEGEGEGALVDLLECVERERFGRTDVANVTFRGPNGPVRNPVRPLIADLDALPWADKSGFYSAVPELEREYYVISRRGCPFRCSFCEYSTFSTQYPGEKPVRRRSVTDVVAELRAVRAGGRVRKVFFWDPIFTLDLHWVREFADTYAREVGIPFECYTHPQTMSDEMASLLAKAGCIMVRVGVQSVNSDTLASVDRKGDRLRVQRTLESLRTHDVPYSVDHIVGLPGEGPIDQLDALHFYNRHRPRRIVAHWMTYFPGTTALEQGRRDGTLSDADVERVLDGDVGPGYIYGGNAGLANQQQLARLRELSAVFDWLPLLPANVVEWLLERERYRYLPGKALLRQLGVLVLAIRGEPATRERALHIAASLYGATRAALARRLGRSASPHPRVNAGAPGAKAYPHRPSAPPVVVRRLAIAPADHFAK